MLSIPANPQSPHLSHSTPSLPIQNLLNAVPLSSHPPTTQHLHPNSPSITSHPTPTPPPLTPLQPPSSPPPILPLPHTTTTTLPHHFRRACRLAACPTALTERQRRLIDAVLSSAVDRPRVRRRSTSRTVFYAFGDILLLFFLAWLLSFALLPLINGCPAAGPEGAPGGRRDRRLPRDRGRAAGDPHPGVGLAGLLDQRVHPGRPEPRDPADQHSCASSRRGSPALGFTVDLVEPGPADRGQPPGLGRRSSSARSSRSPSPASASSATS